MVTPDRRLHWLLACADRLTRGRPCPIHLRQLLADLKVLLVKEVDPQREGTGELRRLHQGGYEIILFRKSADPRPLTHRERFTLAHELGHLLLEKRYEWRPANAAEYHLREDFCNQFAARLLVPTEQLQQLLIASPAVALGHLLHVSPQCRVSLEVAARRITDYFDDVAYLAVTEGMNAQKERVFVTLWGAGYIGQRQIPRRKHLGSGDPVGELLLSRTSQSLSITTFSLPAIGEGVIRPSKGGSLVLAIVRHAAPTASRDEERTVSYGDALAKDESGLVHVE